jgi:hypothetical protein
LVFFTVVVVGAGAGAEALPYEPFDEARLVLRRAVVDEWDVLVRAAVLGAAAAGAALAPRSTAEMLSSERCEFAWFARFRSVCSASLFGLSL